MHVAVKLEIHAYHLRDFVAGFDFCLTYTKPIRSLVSDLEPAGLWRCSDVYHWWNSVFMSVMSFSYIVCYYISVYIICFHMYSIICVWQCLNGKIDFIDFLRPFTEIIEIVCETRQVLNSITHTYIYTHKCIYAHTLTHPHIHTLIL